MEKENKLLSHVIKIMLIFLAAVIMLLIVFFFTLRFVVGGNKVEVPNVIGKSFREAFDILSQQKLRIGVEGHKYSAVLPEDYVVEQRPLPNQKIKADRMVKVFLSRGSETGVVPRVIGQDVSESESTLRSVGLEIGLVLKVHSDDFPQTGIVIAQTPPPSIKIERGSKVNLLVSLGTFSRELMVPDLGGMKLQNAIRVLESAGLNLGNVNRQESEWVREPNVVLEQNPQPDERVESGTSIDLVVSLDEVSDETSRMVFLRYKVPDDPQKSEQTTRHVKIILEHGGGTRLVVDEMFLPGNLLEYPLRIFGQGIAKIYVDDMEWPIETMDL